jgi:hypothetical protein
MQKHFAETIEGLIATSDSLNNHEREQHAQQGEESDDE